MTTKRVHFPAGVDPWEPGMIMFGPRDHWRILAAEPVESPLWVNSWRFTVEALGPHRRDFDALVSAGEPCSIPLDRGERPPDLIVAP